MPLTLTSGNESRTAGAPFIPLDRREEYIRLRARELMIQNELLDEHTALRQAQAEVAEGAAARQAMEARLAQGAADRQRQQAQRRGVDPESLPADEYGAVSARTVRDANLPLDEQEERQGQYDRLASDEIKAMREGRFHGAEAQARQYEQDYGLPTTTSSTGKTDLDYLREIQQQQGFIRTGSGEMIPVGPAITPEAIASRRDFDEWANDTPGTERQALYDPEGYEEFREGVRQDIRDRARASGAYYGTGNDAQLMDAAESGNRTAQDQLDRRMARSASEDRQAEAEREVRIARLARAAGVSREQARIMMDGGRAAARPPVKGKPANPLPLTVEERRLESQSLRDMAGTRRDAELAARQQSLRDQRMLLAPGGRGVVNAINQLPDGWREIALLDRLTNGRVGGPTPLGVAQHQAQAAAEMASRAFTGALANMDPAARAQQQLANDLALAGAPPETKVQLSRQRGEPMGTGYSAAHVGARWNHWTYNLGPRPDSWRLGNFRAEMEGLGYQPAEIDAFIDARMNDPDAGPPAAAAPPAGIPPRASAPPATRGPR